MSCSKAEDLAAEFEALVFNVIRKDSVRQEEAISAWLDGIPAECLRHATRLTQIYRARSLLSTPTGFYSVYITKGDLVMGDQSQKVIDQSTHVTAGGDATGIVGTGGRIEHSVIQAMKDGVKESGNIDQQGVDLFKRLLDEISRCTDSDIQKEAIEELQKLRTELEKKDPKESLVQKSFNALKTFVAFIPTITEIGQWISTKFGWVLV